VTNTESSIEELDNIDTEPKSSKSYKNTSPRKTKKALNNKASPHVNTWLAQLPKKDTNYDEPYFDDEADLAWNNADSASKSSIEVLEDCCIS
jgi:hypothetical protein